jgi:hypothetical protein
MPNEPSATGFDRAVEKCSVSAQENREGFRKEIIKDRRKA